MVEEEGHFHTLGDLVVVRAGDWEEELHHCGSGNGRCPALTADGKTWYASEEAAALDRGAITQGTDGLEDQEGE